MYNSVFPEYRAPARAGVIMSDDDISETEIALTKLDILSGLNVLPLCVAYEQNGKRLDDYPAQIGDLADMTPVYEELPGWEEDIMGRTDYDNLPTEAQQYVRFIEEYVGIPVTIVSNGPAPEHTPDQRRQDLNRARERDQADGGQRRAAA